MLSLCTGDTSSGERSGIGACQLEIEAGSTGPTLMEAGACICKRLLCLCSLRPELFLWFLTGEGEGEGEEEILEDEFGVSIEK